jgi:hypothetical protein
MRLDDQNRQMEQDERVQKIQRAFRARFDGFGYGMFLFLIAGLTWLIADDFGWRMGIFCCLLMLAVLELAYRVYERH